SRGTGPVSKQLLRHPHWHFSNAEFPSGICPTEKSAGTGMAHGSSAFKTGRSGTEEKCDRRVLPHFSIARTGKNSVANRQFVPGILATGGIAFCQRRHRSAGKNFG